MPWHPQILADQLTLSQPGRGGGIMLCPNKITGTPGFSDLPTVLLISVPFKLLPLLMAGIFALIVFATSTSKCLGKSDLINILPFFAPSISALVLVSTWFFRTLLGCSLYIFHFFHGSFLLPYLSSYLNKIYNFV